MAPGTEVGRFIVQAPLGTGGMGVVHAALDLVLGRKVALKLIRADHIEGLASEEWRARLLREARAIARLSHPNAGRGLLAAHLASLVHRDFKPDNVLIGHDGWIRVTDFGLACPLPDTDRHGADRPAPEACQETLRALGFYVAGREAHLTRTGALVGTPGYIAPEVLCGGAADFASDQFSFCVTLHEALFRERPAPRASPKPGVHVSGAVTGIERKPRARVRSDRYAAPGWLQQTVQRGLSTRPEDRFPSMDSPRRRSNADTSSARRPTWAHRACRRLDRRVG